MKRFIRLCTQPLKHVLHITFTCHALSSLNPLVLTVYSENMRETWRRSCLLTLETGTVTVGEARTLHFGLLTEVKPVRTYSKYDTQGQAYACRAAFTCHVVGLRTHHKSSWRYSLGMHTVFMPDFPYFATGKKGCR